VTRLATFQSSSNSSDVYDIPATIYKWLKENMITTMWIGKISFCALLWQSITLKSSALNRTQTVRLCLFCDHRNRGNTPQAKHISPDFSLTILKFPEFSRFSRFSRLVAALSDSWPQTPSINAGREDMPPCTLVLWALQLRSPCLRNQTSF